MNKRRGFSLLEILVAIVVVSVGTLAIINWMPLALRTKTNLEKRTKALFLAQEKIEEIKSRAVANFTDYVIQDSQAIWPSPYDTFLWTASDDQGDNIRVISVTVWEIEDADNKITFDTKIALR
jgi:prepilin-type N-terminal cleavage/methylation domain-containing protein